MSNEAGSVRRYHDVPERERLILALDVPSLEKAHELMGFVFGPVRFFKIGLELLTSGRAFDVVSRITETGRRVMVDLKLHDIPNTVAGAVRGLQQYNPHFITVHAKKKVVEAAVGARGKGMHILAVTVLTSEDQADMQDEGYPDSLTVEQLVLNRARIALKAGADGLVCSGHEVALLRREFGDKPILVVPGVRPAGSEGADDQKRVVTVAQAFQYGADHIVVGRPISGAVNSEAAALQIQDTIRALFR